MRVWEYGSMGVWEYGSMGVWEYEGLGNTVICQPTLGSSKISN